MTDSDRRSFTDLLVIGGGITGAGIAQDAASRGIKTILVEMGDYASGTSSRSSKLIHGGLRYLEQFSLGLMYESVSERHRLTQLAPGLVRWTPFILPQYRGTGKRWRNAIGLWLYDHLAKTETDLRHKRLDAAQLLDYVPQLKSRELTGGAIYYDCITDDARLTLSLVLDAKARGARTFNYVAAEEIIREQGKAAGAQVRDLLTGESWRITARQLVMATGPWTDHSLHALEEERQERRIRPAKGVHILLPRTCLDLHHVVLVPSARDTRSLFVIPWYESILVGTTDTEYSGRPEDVRPELEDIEYILDAIHNSFPGARLTLDDIIASYAGIRPLIHRTAKSTSDVPREYGIFESASGMLCVAGGKLTTYRRMAKVVVDRVVRKLRSNTSDLAILPCWTHRLPIGNPAHEDFNPFGQIELAEDIRHHLLADYGLWACQIASILEVYPQWSRRIAPGLPYILAEVYFAVTREQARTLEDVLARRTRVTLLDPDQGKASLEVIADIVATELGWSAEERKRQVEEYGKTLETKYPSPRIFQSKPES